MRKNWKWGFDDGMDGAVDIVFLLIIFFLVASSFDRTVLEKLVLPERDPDKSVSTSSQERQRLDITIYPDSRIAVNHEEVMIDDPNAVQAYEAVTDAIEEWVATKNPDMPFEVAIKDVDVFVTTDQKSYAGAALNVIMACLDKGVTPQVIFEEAQVAKR